MSTDGYQRQRKANRQRQRKANRTPKEVDADRARATRWQRAKRAARTPEQIASDRAAQKEYSDSRRERINRLERENYARSPAFRAKQISGHARRWRNLTAEQKQEIAKRQTERRRKYPARRAAWRLEQKGREQHLARKRYATEHYGEYSEAWLALMQLENEQLKQMENDHGKS